MNKKKRRPQVVSFAETKKRRMGISVSEEANELIRSESAKKGVTMSDYITDIALSFQADEISKKLDATLQKLKRHINAFNKLHPDDPIRLKYRNKGDVIMAEKGKKAETKQFHLRVTQETFDEIKRRANAMSLSVSDYIVFVTMHYDVMEVSRKIDEINARLDAMMPST